MSERLDQLRAKLKASTKGPNGPPLPGYGARVEALKAEITRLEGEAGGEA